MKYNVKPIECKSIKDLDPELRPREKIQTAGPSGLSDLELFCCILGSGRRDASVQSIAKDILDLLSLKGNVTNSDLKGIKGLGDAKAAIVAASLELGRRFSGERRKRYDSPEELYNLIRHYGDRRQEHFISILLNGGLEVIGVNVVTVGLVNRTLVHPREVFSDAIKNRATFMVIAHNHPSGVLEPSGSDLELTQSLIEAGKIIGIGIIDHIIFNNESFTSLAKRGVKF